MRKCEVLVERVSLVVGKGSIVVVDEQQYEIARSFLKPIGEAKAVAAAKPEEKVEAPKEESVKEVEKPKRKKK